MLFDSVKRFLISSPPLVIFMLSVGLMGLGVFSLAWTVHKDASDVEDDNTLFGATFCLMETTSVPNNNNGSPRLGINSPLSAANLRQAHVSFPVKLLLATKDNASIFGDVLGVKLQVNFTGVVLQGVLSHGQLGLKGIDLSTKWTFSIPVSFNQTQTSCTNAETCEISTFLTLFGEEETLPNIRLCDTKVCNTSAALDPRYIPVQLQPTSEVKSTEKSSNRKSISSVPLPCSTQISVQIEDWRTFILLPMIHDTITARLHLLYTSCFLFMVLVTILFVGTCRHLSVLRMHHKGASLLKGGEEFSAS